MKLPRFVLLQRAGPEKITKECTVVVLGWLGSHRKHVDKYRQVWHNMGAETYSYTTPAPLWLAQNRLSTVFGGLYDDVRKLRDDKKPIIFHVMSNNGFYTYCHLLEKFVVEDPKVLDSNRGKLDVDDGVPTFEPPPEQNFSRAVIVDCAPSLVSETNCVKSFTATMTGVFTKPVYNHYLMTPFAKRIFKNTLKKYPDMIQKFENLRELFLSTPIGGRKCFMYSDGDELVLPEEVEPYVQEYARRHGDLAQIVVFPKTCPHVQLLRHHRDIYVPILERLMDSCIADSVPK
eukprot:Platyproteum_vivax@DN4077_c0_g1_i1.p1